MKKLSLLLWCGIFPLVLAAVHIGEAAPELADCVWVKGNAVNLSQLSKERPVVVFFWNIGYASNQELNALLPVVKQWEKQATFVAVGCDDEEKLRNFFRLPQLPFAVAADVRLTNLRNYLLDNEQIPLALVIAPGGKVAWRGKCAGLPAVLEQIHSGKYDLDSAARREKFFLALEIAMKNSDFNQALALVNVELGCSPDDLELFIFKLNLLEKKLNDVSAAQTEINRAIERNQRQAPLYELKLQSLRKHKQLDKIFPVIDAITKIFASDYVVLSHFLALEIQQPPELSCPRGVIRLGRAVAALPRYADNRQKAMSKILLAQALNYCGAPEKSAQAVAEARKLFTDPRDIERADAMLRHYQELAEVQKNLGR